MDALDIAILVEVEALERYELFTNQLGHRYPEDAASVFRMMAINEKKHAVATVGAAAFSTLADADAFFFAGLAILLFSL